METMTTAQAAEKLRCSETTVHRLLDDGDLDGYRLRGVIRIDADSVEQYLREQMSIPAGDRELQSAVALQRRARIKEQKEARAPDQLDLLMAGK